MCGRRRSPLLHWLHLAAVILALALPGHGSGQATTAVGNLAGIIVDYGDGRVSYAIVPYEGTISGIELLHRSGLSLLTVDFGSLGEGVCQVEKVGCDLDACRSRLCQTGNPESPFWQYAQRSEDGAWQVAPLGASSSTVADGTVDGWFWTATRPSGPAPALADVAETVDADVDLVRAGADFAPVVLTVGDDPEEGDGPAWTSIVTGAALIIAVATIGALLAWRARRPVPT